MIIKLNIKLFYLLCLISTFSLVMGSCRQEPEFEITTEKLEGEWQIIEAFREGKKTRLLDNGIFRFSNHNHFETNILQDSNVYNYILDEKIIIVEDTPRSRFSVIGFAQDSLTLKSIIRDFDFRFVLTRTNQHDEN